MGLKQKLAFLLLMTNFIVIAQNKKTEAEFKKTCSEIVNAFAKKNITAINKHINSQAGVYVITRPGAMDAFTLFKKLDSKKPIEPKYPYYDTSSVKKHTVKYGLVPTYNCGNMKWSARGFTTDTISKCNRISELMDFRTKQEGEKYSEEDKTRVYEIEKRMRKVVFTDIAKRHGLVFYMSIMNGKWYLTVVDTTVGLCGA